jgi:ABC-type cobalamin transport system ATPase subunit
MERHRINAELKRITEEKRIDDLDDTMEIYQKLEGGEWEKVRIKKIQKSV